MNNDLDNLRKAQGEFVTLKSHARSLILATVDNEGLPRASYAPFIYHAQCFHIYVSRLSTHTGELQANPHASIMLIEDEANTAQIFARKRLSYACECVELDSNESTYDGILDLFNQRFGRVMELLRSLPDFVLFKLSPQSGRFVTGFGQAYDLTGDDLSNLLHVSPERINPG